MEFLLGLFTGVFVGAFLWTALTVREAERRAARRCDEKIAARYRHPAGGAHFKVR